jgi:hypothetical protein
MNASTWVSRATRLHLLPNRTFFASSTDHTRLLQDAHIHRIQITDDKVQYILAPDGIDADMVKKVPQLHLARIFLDRDIIYGAKVVNRTLGVESHVCHRLLHAARMDGGIYAHSNLHGLTDWVQKHKLLDRSETEAKILKEIIDGNQSSYDKDVWANLAMEYAISGLGGEANLYLSNNGVFDSILHHTDKTDFSDTCAGAMALFSF